MEAEIMHGRIMVVEDRETTRVAMCTYLKVTDPDLAVTEAEDGVLAIEAATLVRPDVVIMDFVLPNMTGVEAARQIIAMSPGSRLIFVTGYRESWMREKSVELGAFGFVQKGRNLSELADMVHAALRELRQRPMTFGPQCEVQQDGGAPPAAGPGVGPITEAEAAVA